MKKSITAILLAALTMISTAPVAADSLGEVLNLYGASTDSVDQATFERTLEMVKQEYREMVDLWTADEYFRRSQEVSEYMESDSTDILIKLDNDRRYLVSLVNVEADLSLIFEAENEYRDTLRECSEKVFGRTEFNLDDFSLSGVTSGEINAVVDSINQMIEEMNTRSFRPDIGSFDALQTPTKDNWRITSNYGYRTNPITGNGQEFHNGLDLAAPHGTDVLTLFAGTVIFAGNKGDSLGNYVLVAHSNEFHTLYGHMSSLNVSTGDIVSQYDKIGEVGSTGRSTGPHLHLSVYINSQLSDPMRLFKEGDR